MGYDKLNNTNVACPRILIDSLISYILYYNKAKFQNFESNLTLSQQKSYKRKGWGLRETHLWAGEMLAHGIVTPLSI